MKKGIFSVLQVQTNLAVTFFSGLENETRVVFTAWKSGYWMQY